MSAYQAIFGNGLPPALVLIVAGLVAPLFEEKVKKTVYLAASLITILIIINTPIMTGWIIENGFTGKIILGHVDRMSRIFGVIFSIITFAGLIFAINSKSSLKISSGLVYAGGAFGVIFAGDFFSLYIFWEIMAVASTFLILDGNSDDSTKAAFRYILIHIGGGLFLLGGIIIHVVKTGSYEITGLSLENLEGSLIFTGIAVNAAMFPIHSWLKDAYPEASPEGSVFLSAFTTKSAVYLFARTFGGTELLIYGGLCMAVIPLFYALVENDIRRTLAYCLINQVGFMLVAIGIGTPLAIDGACAHAFSHILYKALLFMVAGAVIYRTGKRKFSDLGGLYKFMPITTFFAIIAALSVSVPFFCGFASKSLIIASAEESHRFITWLLLEFGAAGVFIAAGVKFVYGIFFGRTCKSSPEEAPLNMLSAMAIISAVSVSVGLKPELLYSMLPYPHNGEGLYAASHLIPQIELLLFALFGYIIFRQMNLIQAETKGQLLDTDFFYIIGGRFLFNFFDKTLNWINLHTDRLFIKIFVRWISDKASNFIVSSGQLLLKLFPEDNRDEVKNFHVHENKSSFPVGINAALSIFFVVVLFLIASN